MMRAQGEARQNMEEMLRQRQEIEHVSNAGSFVVSGGNSGRDDGWDLGRTICGYRIEGDLLFIAQCTITVHSAQCTILHPLIRSIRNQLN